MTRCFFLLAPAALLFAGCHETAAKPFPLPASFAVQTLSGQHLTPAGMRGSPWVVNFWLPT
jgi:hypothetical protein